MSTQQHINQLTEVLHLYYEQGLNQKMISKKINASVSTVSRMIKEAHELGMVEITIKYPFETIPSIANDLKNKFGLKDAYVLPATGSSYYDQVKNLGQVAAKVLDSYFKENHILGISLGMAVASTVRAFNNTEKKGSQIVRFQGAADFELMEGTNLAQILADKVNGKATEIPSPWLLPTAEVCETIINDPAVKRIIDLAENADLGLVGMGSMDPAHSTLLRNQLLTHEQLDQLRKAGSVGEIFGKHYDKDGNTLDIDFNKRTASIRLECLKQIDTVIGIAVGSCKAGPLRGAIKGGLINVIVTDLDAATKLLEND
ncbi:MAG: hypothetical protein JEZ00_21075 [Anaerolineaceae bacterium]|nr:hypothetical protein [Anaerolineaceae bacterium]